MAWLGDISMVSSHEPEHSNSMLERVSNHSEGPATLLQGFSGTQTSHAHHPVLAFTPFSC